MQNIKNVGIVGSRDFDNYKFLKYMLDIFRFNNIKIISGGANGADTLAIKYAKECGFNFQEFLPQYDKYPPKVAPIMRNKTIVENSDIIIAFWDGSSPGTKNTIKFAKEQNKPYYIFYSSKK